MLLHHSVKLPRDLAGLGLRLFDSNQRALLWYWYDTKCDGCAEQHIVCKIDWRCLWHLCWQLEKKKMDAEIPMLLPKSNSVVSVPRWAANSAFCCNTQVSEWEVGDEYSFDSSQSQLITCVSASDDVYSCHLSRLICSHVTCDQEQLINDSVLQHGSYCRQQTRNIFIILHCI